MADSRKRYAAVLIVLLLAVQTLAGLWHIRDPFVDGRYHYNWAPPFWLMKAKATNEAGMVRSAFGIVSGITRDDKGEIVRLSYYSSHPQLLGPSFALWTKVFGYREWSSRLFTLLLSVATAALFIFALRKAFGISFALLSGTLFAALPLIYIYGKRIDFENLVLFWLAVAFLGYMKLFRKERYALPLFYAGCIATALSDWSGFVLVFFVGVFSLAFFREDKGCAKKAALAAGVSIVAALFLFALQNYVQGDYAGLGDFFQRYVELVRYRTDIDTGSIPWSLWAFKQWVHVRMNFSALLSIAAVLGLFGAAHALMRRKKTSPLEERAALSFAIASFLGGLAWIVLIKQGSFIHLSYQYFFSLPVVVGGIWFLYRLSGRVNGRSMSRDQAFVGLATLLILFTMWNAYRMYVNLLTKDFNGDATDVAFVKSLRELPRGEDARIVALGDPNEVEWWSAPNIEYYAGRAVKAQSFEKVPLVPYQIVPKRFAERIAGLITNGSSYGTPYETATKECSTNFCLLEVRGIGAQ